MAEWLQQLDPSKLVLAETVSATFKTVSIILSFVSLSVGDIGLVFHYFALHIAIVQLAHISLWDVCSGEH